MTDGMGGIQATYDLAERDRGYGYGGGYVCGDGMYGGGWMWIILILLFAGRGFGWNNGQGVQDNFISSEFIKRDVFNTDQNVSTTGCQTQRDVLENRYTTQLGLQQLGSQMQNCCCETSKEILQNRYDNALQTNTLQAQIAQCCCDLRAEGLANTQKILDKLCQSEIQNLRDVNIQQALQLSQQAQSANLIAALRPSPIPAYLTCSPYESALFGSCGFNRFGNCGGCGNFNI